MVSEVPVTQNRIAINARVQETGGPTGGAQLSRNIAGELRNQRDQYQAKAAENAYLQGQTVLTRDLDRIRNEHQADPETLSTALEEYGQSFLDEVSDPNMRTRFQLQLEKNAQSAISQATARRQIIIDDEARFQAFQSIDLIETELANTAVNLYDPNPAVALAASEQIQEIMMRGQAVINQRSADGTPLIPAQQRASTLFAIRDSSYKAAASAWFDSQPNKLAAAQEWLDGNVSITLPDEDGNPLEVNLRDTMPASSRTKVDADIISMLRDQISIQNQQNTLQDRADEQRADQLFIKHQTYLQNGEPLTLKELDANKQVYVAGGLEKEYIALRNTIIQGNPTAINGTIRNQLFNMAYSGIDPTDFGRTAVRDRLVDWQTVEDARRIFKAQTGPGADIQDFYINQLVRALGGQNQNLDISGQETISRAVIEMRQLFMQLQEGNQLNDAKAREVFNLVLENNSNLTLEDRVIARTPQFIPKSAVGKKASSETAKDFENQILDYFLEKYEGDIDKIKNDPDFVGAQKWLQDYKGQIRQNINRIE